MLAHELGRQLQAASSSWEDFGADLEGSQRSLHMAGPCAGDAVLGHGGYESPLSTKNSIRGGNSLVYHAVMRVAR